MKGSWKHPTPGRWIRGLKAAFAGVLTLGLLAALGLTGELGYAASTIGHALTSAKHAVTNSRSAGPVVVAGLSAGGDQYRPGFGFGDPKHVHRGKPRLNVPGGAFAPPLFAQPTGDGAAATVSTKVSIDEQAHLWISVLRGDGRPLLLTQGSKGGGSRVGGPVAGPQTKSIQYALLVPRTIRLSLRIPVNLLERGAVYRIQIVAVSPIGERARLLIPFRA